jgi:peptide/nickel transport system permease protein
VRTVAAKSRGRGLPGGAFARFLLRRVLLAVIVVLGVVVITFFLSHVIPADPAILLAGGQKPPASEIARVRALYHLNDPLPVQFGYYLSDLLHGNLGTSFRTTNPVALDLASALPATLELIMYSLILALLLGIPLGVIAGIRQGKWPDHLTRLLAVGGVALPTFWLAVLFQILFSQMLHVLPVSGRYDPVLAITDPIPTVTGFLTVDSILAGNPFRFVDAAIHLVLPCVTLALYPIGLVARMVRSMMVEVLGENYIRTARAFGLPARLIEYRYALKNAISPAIVAIGLSIAYSLTGAFLIEYIYQWNGIGQYAYLAVIDFDYPAILGVTVVVAIFYVVVNLAVDLIQALLDPRVVLARSGG